MSKLRTSPLQPRLPQSRYVSEQTDKREFALSLEIADQLALDQVQPYCAAQANMETTLPGAEADKGQGQLSGSHVPGPGDQLS